MKINRRKTIFEIICFIKQIILKHPNAATRPGREHAISTTAAPCLMIGGATRVVDYEEAALQFLRGHTASASTGASDYVWAYTDSSPPSSCHQPRSPLLTMNQTRQPDPLYAGPRQGNGDTDSNSADGIAARAQRFEDEKQRIIESLFAKKDPDGMNVESYITHVRVCARVIEFEIRRVADGNADPRGHVIPVISTTTQFGF